MMPSLALPLALLALPLPLVAARLLRPSAAASAALRVPATILRENGRAGLSREAGGRAPFLLAWAAWIALVVALAGPQIVTATAALPMSGREIVLALDASGSMESKDFVLDGMAVRRFDAVKAVARDFLRRRGGDRVGLVFFAEQAEVAMVPTFDLAAVEDVLMDTEIGMLGRSTAIGDGLGLAVKRLKESASPSRVIILLSDGTNTAGVVGADTAAELARELSIRVHTISLGTDDAADPADRVDAPTLERIAQMSGGRSFRVRTLEDLRAVAAEIEAMEPVRFDGAPVSVARELWPWPAGAALLLCLIGFHVGRRQINGRPA